MKVSLSPDIIICGMDRLGVRQVPEGSVFTSGSDAPSYPQKKKIDFCAFCKYKQPKCKDRYYSINNNKDE